MRENLAIAGCQKGKAISAQVDRLDERDDFFERVRAGFRARAAAEPQRFRVIDAAQPPAGVAAAVEAAITAYLRTLTDSDLA